MDDAVSTDPSGNVDCHRDMDMESESFQGPVMITVSIRTEAPVMITVPWGLEMPSGENRRAWFLPGHCPQSDVRW
jgi:hypothetical protein